MILNFGIEPLATLREEAAALLQAHYEEVGNQSADLAPDWELGERMESGRSLICYTARDAETLRLMGYAVYVVGPLPHYRRVLAADADLFFLAAEARRGMNAVRFLGYCQDNLRDQGVKRLRHRVKIGMDWSAILIRHGFHAVETTYERPL